MVQAAGARPAVRAAEDCLVAVFQPYAVKLARDEAERWGWAGATEQLRGYYRQVLSQQRSPALAG